MSLRSLLLLMSLIVLSSANASILPKNNLHLQDHPALIANLTEQEFNDLIDRVENYYAPIVESHGATLIIKRKWTDRTVNAYAQQLGTDWVISMFGGLARRNEITHDGFTLVICHEAGHHLGGYPFVSSWASNEGQSDYFASQSCLKNIWRDDLITNASFRESVNPVAKDQCDSIYVEKADQDLCYRTAMAGKSVADLLATLGKQDLPSFLTPDENRVMRTYNSHPKAQCRLDTYLSGALCTVEFDETIIPGIGINDRWGKRRELKLNL